MYSKTIKPIITITKHCAGEKGKGTIKIGLKIFILSYRKRIRAVEAQVIQRSVLILSHCT